MEPHFHSGIRSFRPQISKEERFKNSISMDNHDFYDDEDAEDMVALRDDLESTKQLLELEVRSKKLLEKDNKRLAQELEKLKQEMCNKPGISNEPIESSGEDPGRARRNSIANKRHSVIRLLSESENKETEQEVIAAGNDCFKKGAKYSELHKICRIYIVSLLTVLGGSLGHCHFYFESLSMLRHNLYNKCNSSQAVLLKLF